MSLELAAKHIELIKEFLPELTNVAVLWREGGDATFFKRLEGQLNGAVDRFGMRWRVYIHQSRPDDLEPHFRAMRQDGYNLLYLVSTQFTFSQSQTDQ